MPVIRDAQELSVEGLASRIKDLAKRGRVNQLTPDVVRGGSFTITDHVGNDSIAIRPMTYLCMSWDHRALDGALAAQFLNELRKKLESWPTT